MERPIGQVFELKLRLEVSEGNSCAECVFCDVDCCNIRGLGICSPDLRTDGKKVVFEKVYYDVVNIDV